MKKFFAIGPALFVAACVCGLMATPDSLQAISPDEARCVWGGACGGRSNTEDYQCTNWPHSGFGSGKNTYWVTTGSGSYGKQNRRIECPCDTSNTKDVDESVGSCTTSTSAPSTP